MFHNPPVSLSLLHDSLKLHTHTHTHTHTFTMRKMTIGSLDGESKDGYGNGCKSKMEWFVKRLEFLSENIHLRSTQARCSIIFWPASLSLSHSLSLALSFLSHTHTRTHTSLPSFLSLPHFHAQTSMAHSLSLSFSGIFSWNNLLEEVSKLIGEIPWEISARMTNWNFCENIQ